MIEWWNQLITAQQVFALIAIPATLVLLIQTVLLLVGLGGGEADLDGDEGALSEGVSDGLVLFSVRGIVSMLTVMGWSAVALLETRLAPWLAVMIAVILGLLTLVGMAYLMRAVARLQASGNLDVENAVGKVARVYIPIPPKGKGTGKVTLTLQETYSEFSAITAAPERLATGTYVRVVAVDGAGTLVVEPVISEETGENA